MDSPLLSALVGALVTALIGPPIFFWYKGWLANKSKRGPVKQTTSESKSE